VFHPRLEIIIAVATSLKKRNSRLS